MLGLMQDRPLLISQILDYAAEFHPNGEIVTRTVEGPIHRYSYAEASRRAKQLAEALTELGIVLGDRIGTIAWNTHRHLELYYGVSGLGAVLHTLNPRLAPEHVIYIANHAEDRLIFVDLNLLPIVEGVFEHLKTVEHVVVMTDRAHMPTESAIPNLLCFEELLDGRPGALDWPEFDERTASSLCYTSGTTGNPKGVLYSHRSTLLHTLATLTAPVLGLKATNTILPVVPMFHANAWGTVYAAPMAGAKLVLPGPKLDGGSICELLQAEDVDIAAGVPTVWLDLLRHCEENGIRLDKVERTLCGGSAIPQAMIERFWNEHGVEMVHGWGMTEMSPIGTTTWYRADEADLTPEEKFPLMARQGRPIFGVEMKITGPAGEDLPKDGEASGELLVRGPWIVSGYFKGDGQESFRDGDWFDTGDVSKLDPDGWMIITDRSKDVIKSGGEWISSIDLENAAMGCPGVAEAAVIGLPHPKWDERPLLVIVPKPGEKPSSEQILDYLTGKVAKWWLPDDIVYVESMPHGATGKVLKVQLREQFADHRLPTA